MSSDDEIGEDQSSTSDQQGTPPGEPLDGAERGSSSDGDNSLGEGDSEDSSPSGKDGLPDDREEPLSFGLTPEKLFELQILYGKTTKGVHFYEIVMTTALGIQLKKTMTLSKFAEYVVDCTACQTEPGKQFNIILELFGRKLPGVVVSKQNKEDKVIERCSVIDGKWLVDIFRKKSHAIKEWNFLKALKEMVAFGDFNGIPLLLAESKKEDDEFVTILIPHYGQTLSTFFKNNLETIDKDTLALALLATFCSLTFEHGDLHDKNVCVYKPGINFIYKWTIQVNNHLFELSWNFNGLLNTIDWESCYNFPNAYSLSKSTYTPFSRQLWEIEIKDEYRTYGIPACLTGPFKGEVGMYTFLYNVFTSFDDKKYSFKCVTLKGSRRGIVTSTLQVFPSEKNVTGGYDKKLRKTWNRKMSETGSALKNQRCLTESNIRQMKELYQDFHKFRDTPEFDIPSDTGLVALTKKRILVAKKVINEGETVTHIPITKTELFDSQQIWIQSVQGSIFKKMSPFCGFGAFVKFNSEQSNCTIDTSGPKGAFVCLVATKPISPGEPVISDTTSLVKRIDSHASDTICDVSVARRIVKDCISDSPETRSSSRQSGTADDPVL